MEDPEPGITTLGWVPERIQCQLEYPNAQRWGVSYGMSFTTAYCADDVADVAIGNELEDTEDVCSKRINRIRNWLTGAGLELAAYKTEVVQ
ncbi:hypothetical protein AWZ03_015041 [Drosophila navojoa]|uniref:Uncharacterized protein n=1 Tax=Drosophila navojoa TaxID=7232 RepID=A0A484ANK3_DRONA|nr:hypothetical protein AWZ03_015041 [Drosophila navojoa]